MTKMKIEDRIGKFVESWTENAPEAKFAGMTLAEFQTAIAPSQTIRAEMSATRTGIQGQIATRNAADGITRNVLERVVASVIADAAHGSNSAMYRGMNYVTKDERSSGKVNKPAAIAPATTPAA